MGPGEWGQSRRCWGVRLPSGVGPGPLTCSPSSVQLTLPPGLEMALGPGREYRALQLHLHWGSADRPGSEHKVGGHRFPAEVRAQLSAEGRRGRGAGDLAHFYLPLLFRSTWFTSALHLPKSMRPWGAQGAWRCWPPFCRYQAWTLPTPCFPMPWGSAYLAPRGPIPAYSLWHLAIILIHSLVHSLNTHCEPGPGPQKGFRNP